MTLADIESVTGYELDTQLIQSIWDSTINVYGPESLKYFAIFLALTMLVYSLDDLVIDVLSWFKGSGPKELKLPDLQVLHNMNQKRIAICIANWHEDEILERMIEGNLKQIDYKNYQIILGVYPNDTATWEVARRLESKHKQVTVIVNSMNGPTSKGQMLNEMATQISNMNKSSDSPIEILMIHDSEDIIHPLSLKLMNWQNQRGTDFIQIPVFPLQVKMTELVAGTYKDEFIEFHCKDLLVRSDMNAGVPSAGVGTAMSWKLVEHFRKVRGGNFMPENSLTEDYILGMESHRAGFKAAFLNFFIKNEDNKKEFIATREFFPRQFKRSVNQRTRWITGIIFQGVQMLGWKSPDIWTGYFLMRDRRGVLNALLQGFAMLLLAIGVMKFIATGRGFEFMSDDLFITLISINLFFMVFRMIQKMRYTFMVYGLATALFVPIRWLVGNLITVASTGKAYLTFRKHLKTGKAMAWAKTTHELPPEFGTSTASTKPAELAN